MDNKVLLILVDGLRPDVLDKCGDNYLYDLAKNSLSTLQAHTTMPSVTLPCHTSLFYGVESGRHGITTNSWTPMVRPIDSLFTVIHNAGGRCAAFYTWEQLREMWAPGTMDFVFYTNIHTNDNTDALAADFAGSYIPSAKPDFAFLYLGQTDSMGHDYGWMGEEYKNHVKTVNGIIRHLMMRIQNDYTVIITADHGGHDRCHGTDLPEDMTTPLIIHGKNIKPGHLADADIRDIAPTIAKMLGAKKPDEWEGKELI